MCVSIDNIVECCAIEIVNKEGRNAIISCIYRTPDSNMTDFNKIIENYLNGLKIHHKIVYVCGDFNIDLLKCANHSDSKDFIDIMYGQGLFHLMCKPTRVNNYTATLIDNIFTNNITVNIGCGIFINDISDHFPIFMICNKRFKTDVNNKFRRVRDTSESNVLNLYYNLMVYNWEILYKEKDVNNAYKTFLEIFIDLYNTTCPFKTIRVKHNMFKPWFTEGLKAACKKRT